MESGQDFGQTHLVLFHGIVPRVDQEGVVPRIAITHIDARRHTDIVAGQSTRNMAIYMRVADTERSTTGYFE
jgi:hypothetical protein